MRPLAHFAEPRHSYGGLAAEGALNLLGRPDLDKLTILVREAVQNSWDAAAGTAPVRVEIALRTLTAEQTAFLRTQILTDLPGEGVFRGTTPDERAREPGEVVASDTVRVLTITDRGTTGLGGPVSADVSIRQGETADFVDLVFNIGQPPDKVEGAGSYGFGKTISYLTSRCRAVLIHSSTMYRGQHEQRLIVQALGRQYSWQGRNYTGRHWWGERRTDGIEPVTGQHAARCARGLGLPEFPDGQTGTTLMVLDPDLAERPLQATLEHIGEALLWNFWPKMVPPPGSEVPAMQFELTCDGAPVPLVNPAESSPLSGFVATLQAVRACESGTLEPADFPLMQIHRVVSRRPVAHLGWLAMLPTAVEPSAHLGPAAPFTGPAHHIALMRRAELVVQYLPGPERETSAIQWCGVFRCSPETDSAFKRAEPPAHDDWSAKLLGNRRDKTAVNVAMREIRAAAESAYGPWTTVPTGESSQRSAVIVADLLGDVMSTVGGAAPSPSVRSGRHRTGAPASAQVQVVRQWLRPDKDASRLFLELSVQHASGTPTTPLKAEAAASAGDGSAESEPPAGADTPRILGWSYGGRHVPGPRFDAPTGGGVTQVVLEVQQVAGTGTTVDVRVDDGEETG